MTMIITMAVISDQKGRCESLQEHDSLKALQFSIPD